MDMPNLPNQTAAAGPPPPSGLPSAGQSSFSPQQSQPRVPTPTDPTGNDKTEVFQQSYPPSEQPQQPQQSQPQSETANASDSVPQDQYRESNFAYNRPMPEEVLIEWQAPSRPFKQRNRQYFTTIGVICLLIAMILFFAGQMLPVAVIAAVFFVYYVLNSTPPGMVNHKFTTYGIRIENNLYYWDEMGRFWLTEKFGQPLLHIEVDRFPNRLTILIGDLDKGDVTEFLSELLLNQQPPPTTYEKAAQWLQNKLPIDIESTD